MPKTATTSMQMTLHKNKNILNANGYHKLEYLISHRSFMNLMFEKKSKMITFFQDKGRNKNQVRDYRVKEKQFFYNQIRNLTAHTLIISSENIYLKSKKILRQLRKLLNKTLPNARLIVIVYVRRFDRFAASNYQQQVCGGYYNKESEYFLEFSYKRNIEKFSEVFGLDNLVVRCFDETCTNEGPVIDFFEVIGLGDMKSELVQHKHNVGRSDKAIDLIKFINDMIPMYVDGKLNVLRSKEDVLPLFKIRGDKFRFDEKYISRLNYHISNEYNWLEDNFDITFDSEQYKTSETICFDNDYYSDITNVFSEVSSTIKDMIVKYLLYKIKNGYESDQILLRLFDELKEDNG
jgi:hypothetical protein